jgi:hypothetical protein
MSLCLSLFSFLSSRLTAAASLSICFRFVSSSSRSYTSKETCKRERSQFLFPFRPFGSFEELLRQQRFVFGVRLTRCELPEAEKKRKSEKREIETAIREDKERQRQRKPSSRPLSLLLSLLLSLSIFYLYLSSSVSLST